MRQQGGIWLTKAQSSLRWPAQQDEEACAAQRLAAYQVEVAFVLMLVDHTLHCNAARIILADCHSHGKCQARHFDAMPLTFPTLSRQVLNI